MENHYVCTGTCGGVSDHPKNCEDESCPMHGQPLVACDCTDGQHQYVKGETKIEEEK